MYRYRGSKIKKRGAGAINKKIRQPKDPNYFFVSVLESTLVPPTLKTITTMLFKISNR